MVGIMDIKEIFDKTHESINQIGLLARWLNKRYDFTKAAEDYKKRLDKFYDTVKIIGMSEPMKLRSIYTRVNVLETITALNSISVEELENFYDKDRRAFKNAAHTQEGIKVVNELSKIVLLGKPGAGKTTFLKYIVLQSADGLLKINRIPIFISLKEWSDTDKSLMAFIVEQFDICKFEKAGPFIDRMLSLGKCLVLLDGLDEVSRDKEDHVIKEVQDFSNRYTDNAFIISCRIAAYKYLLPHFTEVELADFDDGQIKHFINSWFGSNVKKAELCWKAMENNPPIKELACVPLLLTLLCLNFDDTMEFPKNKGELYQKGIDALLAKWDSSRNIRRQEGYKGLSLKRKITMLSYIAATSFEKDEYFMPQRVLEEYISNFTGNLPETEEKDLIPSSEAILKAVEAHHGIFVERAEKIYSFSHLTFQEYFTANNIVENKDIGSFEKLANRLLEAKWREVILLSVGIVANADGLLLAVKRKVDLLATKQLHLLRCVLNSENLFSPVTALDVGSNPTQIPSLKIKVIKLFLFCDLASAIARIRLSELDRALTRTGDIERANNLVRALALASDRFLTFISGDDRDLALKLASAGASVGANASDRDRDRATACDYARDLVRAIALVRDLGSVRNRDHECDTVLKRASAAVCELSNIGARARTRAYILACKLTTWLTFDLKAANAYMDTYIDAYMKEWRESSLADAQHISAALDRANDLVRNLSSVRASAPDYDCANSLLRELERVRNRKTSFYGSGSARGDIAEAHDIVLDIIADLGFASDLDFANGLDFANSLDFASDCFLELATDLDRDITLFRANSLIDELKVSWFMEMLDVHNKLKTETVKKSHIDSWNKAVGKAIPEISELNEYLYATNLLVECLNNDCYLSKEIRKKIMNELLAVPEQAT